MPRKPNELVPELDPLSRTNPGRRPWDREVPRNLEREVADELAAVDPLELAYRRLFRAIAARLAS